MLDELKEVALGNCMDDDRILTRKHFNRATFMPTIAVPNKVCLKSENLFVVLDSILHKLQGGICMTRSTMYVSTQKPPRFQLCVAMTQVSPTQQKSRHTCKNLWRIF